MVSTARCLIGRLDSGRLGRPNLIGATRFDGVIGLVEWAGQGGARAGHPDIEHATSGQQHTRTR